MQKQRIGIKQVTDSFFFFLVNKQLNPFQVRYEYTKRSLTIENQTRIAGRL